MYPREDVDPDEALAKVLERVGERPGGDYVTLARVAREHIEVEREEGGYNIRRAERERKRRVKAEADVERLTRERDEVWEVANSHFEDARNWQRRYEALQAAVRQVASDEPA